MSPLNDITTLHDVHDRKIVVESDYARYLCFTRLGSINSWILCVTDGSVVWFNEYDTDGLEMLIGLSNQPTIEDFLTKFRECFDNKNASILQVGDKVTLSLTNGFKFDLREATPAETKSALKYILFNLAGANISTEKKLDAANNKIRKLEAQMAAGGSTVKTLMDLGPKKSVPLLKIKANKEGMSVVNPMSKKRKPPQGVVFD